MVHLVKDGKNRGSETLWQGKASIFFVSQDIFWNNKTSECYKYKSERHAGAIYKIKQRNWGLKTYQDIKTVFLCLNWKNSTFNNFYSGQESRIWEPGFRICLGWLLFLVSVITVTWFCSVNLFLYVAGAKIISSKAFCSLNFRTTSRNLSGKPKHLTSAFSWVLHYKADRWYRKEMFQLGGTFCCLWQQILSTKTLIKNCGFNFWKFPVNDWNSIFLNFQDKSDK